MMCTLSQQTVDSILALGRIYEVGGVVRDQMLSGTDNSKDHDYLVTGIPYDSLTAILKKHGRVDLVGQSFGVIKFTQFKDGKPHTFDITLPRKEHSTGVGHRDFEVGFDPDLAVEDDLLRRDFTINAMAVALDGSDLIDPLDGKADLEAHQLRMVHANSFVDDPLRMLRAIQFAARFEFEIEPKTLEALCSNAELVTTVSPERIAEELNKLLTLAAKPSVGFNLMEQTGLLKHILPELQDCVGVEQPGGYHKYTVFEHIIRTIDACKPTLRLRMAALFHDIRKPQHRRLVEGGATFYGHESGGARSATDILSRLRYSNDFIRQVEILVERHMFTTAVTDKGLRRLLRRVGEELIYELLDLRRADVIAQGMGGTTEDVDQFEADIRAELKRKPPLGVTELAIDGDDIMKILKVKPGPIVGNILDELLEKVLDDPELNDRKRLESFANEIYHYNIGKIDNDKDEEQD